MVKYYQQYGILDYYIGFSGKNQFYIMDWYGKRVSKNMPYQFAVKLQNVLIAKQQKYLANPQL